MTTTPAKKKPTPKHKSKGKRHPLHAETLDHLAADCERMNQFVLAHIFRTEAKRVRKSTADVT